MEEVQPALSELLSLKTTNTRINAALSRLNTVLASIALDSAREGGEGSTSSGTAAVFTKSQEGFRHNVTARLIDFVARCLLRLQNHKYGDDYQAIFLQLGQTMKLLQGFLLLHRSSRYLFSIACNMELLITCLTLPDHTATNTGTPNFSDSTTSVISASPTLASIPFDFGASTSSATPSDQPPTLSELTLETLLCALVDTPENVKLFEELGGVADVVRILRGKVEGGRAAKMKSLEFLYFWLYPDNADRQKRETASAQLTPSVPSTPRKSSKTLPSAQSSSHMRRDSTDQRLRAMLESTHDGWSPTTPSKPSRTFEHTQLALSRSAAVAAAAAGGMSPRKRAARFSFTMPQEEEERDVYSSPRPKRSSLLLSQSPARLASSISAARRSPEARRRSVLGISAVSSAASRSGNTPPPSLSPASERNAKLARRSSSIQAGDAQVDRVESYLFKPPRPPLSPYKSESPIPPQLSQSYEPTLAAPVPLRPRLPTTPAYSSHSPSPLAASSAYTPRRSRTSTAIGEGLPGGSGEVKGLFAPSASGRRASCTERAAVEIKEQGGEGEQMGTHQRRRQMLGRYLGNVDQLLERFDGLRCGS